MSVSFPSAPLRSPELRRTLLRSASVLPAAALFVLARKWWLAPFHAHHPTPPELVGFRHVFYSSSGPTPVRIRRGSPGAPVVVLVHGWGGSADSAWWKLLPVLDAHPGASELNLVAVDLPGHGHSPPLSDTPFTIELAARSLASAAVESARFFGSSEVVFAAVSMGGPVTLSAVKLLSEDPSFVSAGVSVRACVLAATTTFWDPFQLQVKTLAAPWVLDEGSPVASFLRRRTLTEASDVASAYAWGFLMRPPRQVLSEALRSLRRFDARRWDFSGLPPLTWVVTSADRVVPASVQRAAAQAVANRVVVLDAPHAVAFTHPAELADVIVDALHGIAGS